MNKEISMPEIRFWLKGLNKLKQDENPDIRNYVTVLLLDMGVEGVSISEILEPIVLYPDNLLISVEKQIRKKILNQK